MSRPRVAVVLMLLAMSILGLVLPTSCAQPVEPLLVVTPQVGVLTTGQPVQLTVTRRFPLGPTEFVTERVNYVTSNKNAATVTDKGLVLPGTEAGPVVIHVTDPTSDAFADVSFTVDVVAAVRIVSIDVAPSPSIVMAPGTTQRFLALGHFSDGVSKDVTDQLVWVSTNEAAVTVVSRGAPTGPGNPPVGTVSAIAVGDTTITATDPQTSVQGGAFVFVRADVAELKALVVTPNPATVHAGATLQLAALGVFSDGTTRDMTKLVGWTSSVTAVASVDGTGLATAVAAGNTTITASTGAAFTPDAGASGDASVPAVVSGSAALTVQ